MKRNLPEVTAESRRNLLARLRHRAKEADKNAPVTRVALSPEQHTLLSAEKLHGNQPVGNLMRSWTLDGPLEAAALERALHQLVWRHDALRMSILQSGDGLTADFAPDREVSLQVETVAGSTRDERMHAADVLARRASQVPFALDGPGLWRIRLVRVDTDKHVLVVIMHHLICDEWSFRNFARDLLQLYEAELGGPAPALAPADSFAAHLATRSTGALGKLGTNCPEIHWPVTHSEMPMHEAVRRETAVRWLDAAEVEALRDVARLYGGTRFNVLLAAYQVVLGAYCDQSDFGVSFSPSNRVGPAEKNAVGLFVRNIEVSTELDTAATFAELLQATIGTLRSALQDDTDPIHLGRAVIGYYNIPNPGLDYGGLSVLPRPRAEVSQSANLHLSLHPDQAGIKVSFSGQRRHFSGVAVEALADCYLLILRQVIDNPEIALGEIALVARQEAARQARRAHVAPDPAATGDIPAAFERVARSHPNAIALTTPGQSVSYAELDRETNALGHWLRAQGLAEGQRLGVAMSRSMAVFKTWIAALKAGLTVVPIDSDLPGSRLRQIIEDAGCAALVSAAGDARIAPGPGLPVLHLPTQRALSALPVAPPDLAGRAPGRDAFVMFTSGTTGHPKSVPVPHAGILRLAVASRHLPVGPGDRVIQLASSGFDGSFIEVWGAWLSGATLCLMEKNILAAGGLAGEFKRLAPTASFMTTSLFNLLVDADPKVFSNLGHLAIGGEAASASHCRRALAANPNLKVRNVYGPTENTSLTTSYQIPTDLAANVPIGRPLPGNRVFVLTSHLNPVPDGFAGELCVGGEGLSSGYENRPGARAESFVSLNARRLGVDADSPVRLYRTGDRVRWNAQGELEYLGRRDTQFKLHGHRIEPSEIETALMAHPTIGRAMVFPDRSAGSDTVSSITACFEVTGAKPPNAQELRSFLAQRLPRPMLPSRYLPIDAIPLTANGKVDVAALARTQPVPARAEDTGLRHDDPLAAIWEQTLGAAAMSDQDNFYVCGGTSLKLVQMILDVEKEFGVEIEFSAFSDHPTLARLRVLAAISPASENRKQPHLRVIRDGSPDLSPIVVMPMITGDVSWAVDIVTALSVDNPVLALDFVPPRDAPLADTHFADLVDGFLKDLTALEAGRPITLLGFSFGGALAGYLAGRARNASLDIEHIIMLDGTSPLVHLSPSRGANGASTNALKQQFFLHPVGGIPSDCHLLRARRGFPFASQDAGRDWSHLVVGKVHEYDIGAYHTSMITPIAADDVAQKIESILRGRSRPDRSYASAFSEPLLKTLNTVKRLSLAGRLGEASRSLESLIPKRGTFPDWIAFNLVKLYLDSGEERRLRALLARSDDFATSRAWQMLFWVMPHGKTNLLRKCYHSSGSCRSGALPLVTRLAQAGRNAEAQGIVEALRSDPELQVEAGLAAAVMSATTDDARTTRAAMEAALASADAVSGHARWAVRFFAQRGMREEAETILERHIARFPDAMNQMRPIVERLSAAAKKRFERHARSQSGQA